MGIDFYDRMWEIEQLEKENVELNRDKTELVNSVTELKDKVTELKKQIEKMKCCGNCDNNSYCEKEHYGNDKGCKDWELAE